jgi:cytochrome c55X
MQRNRINHQYGLMTLWLVLSSTTALADMTPSRQNELRYMLEQDCGSCHGLSLTGGLGPALTPEALAGKASVMLRDVILNGRPGTPMPPWSTFLNPREAEWLVQTLKEGRHASR